MPRRNMKLKLTVILMTGTSLSLLYISRVINILSGVIKLNTEAAGLRILILSISDTLQTTV